MEEAELAEMVSRANGRSAIERKWGRRGFCGWFWGDGYVGSRQNADAL
jgi:hypothetical protein